LLLRARRLQLPRRRRLRSSRLLQPALDAVRQLPNRRVRTGIARLPRNCLWNPVRWTIRAIHVDRWPTDQLVRIQSVRFPPPLPAGGLRQRLTRYVCPRHTIQTIIRDDSFRTNTVRVRPDGIRTNATVPPLSGHNTVSVRSDFATRLPLAWYNAVDIRTVGARTNVTVPPLSRHNAIDIGPTAVPQVDIRAIWTINPSWSIVT
jgi:hypothetical protein